MIAIGRTTRIAAAAAALSANFAVAGGLVLLAQHYDAQAAREPRTLAERGGAAPARIAVIATAQRCRPEAGAPG